MKMKQLFLTGFTTVAALLFAAGTQAYGQPTDAQIKRDISGPKTVSVTLGKPGTRSWSSGFKKYIWSRNFEAKVRTDDPEVFAIVSGYAAYDIVAGRYTFWRTFINSNTIEGIQNPSESDIEALISKFGVQKFMGSGYYNNVIGEVESLKLATDPKFVWHNTNSVSFRVTTVYTEKINDVGGKRRVERNFEIRLYRPDTKADWNNMISSAREYKEL